MLPNLGELEACLGNVRLSLERLSYVRFHFSSENQQHFPTSLLKSQSQIETSHPHHLLFSKQTPNKTGVENWRQSNSKLAPIYLPLSPSFQPRRLGAGVRMVRRSNMENVEHSSLSLSRGRKKKERELFSLRQPPARRVGDAAGLTVLPPLPPANNTILPLSESFNGVLTGR